jgi:hypothetical protein
MKPAPYSYGYHVAGDTLDAVRFQVIVNESSPAVALNSVSAEFYKDGILTLSLPITIINTSTWIFDVGPVSPASMLLAVGTHELQITTEDDDGRVRSYVSGTIKILEKAPA